MHNCSDTAKDAEPVLKHLLDGNEMMTWSAVDHPKELGRGCRERVSKSVASDSEVCWKFTQVVIRFDFKHVLY